MYQLADEGEAEMSDGRKVLFETFPVPTPFSQNGEGPTASRESIDDGGAIKQRRKALIDVPKNHIKKKYKCSGFLEDGQKCMWSFETPAKLKRHYTKHSDIGTFKCQLCDTPVKHIYNLYIHWRTVCTLKDYLDYSDINKTPSQLKKIVAIQMGIMNKFDEFANWGGILFVPSQQYLNDTSDISDLQHTNHCHICSLCVPLKYYKPHVLAHRGFIRVDQECNGKFMCHLCSCTFKIVDELRLHWRKNCPEVQAHILFSKNPDDEELAALVFLLLQQGVPIHVVEQFARQDSIRLKQLANMEQERANLPDKSTLYHLPSEVAPLAVTNILKEEDHEPILKMMDPKIASVLENSDSMDMLNLQEKVNMFAMLCPSFFAIKKEWFIIKNAKTKEVERRVLRYTKGLPVMDDYKITTNSLPFQDDPYNFWKNIGDRKCTRCDLYFSSQGKFQLHFKLCHKTQIGTCILCTGNSESCNNVNRCTDALLSLLIKFSTVENLIDHWRRTCPPMLKAFNDNELESIEISKFRQLVFALRVDDSSIDKLEKLKILKNDIFPPQRNKEQTKTETVE